MYSVDTKLVFEIVFKYHGKYLYLNTVLIQVFAIVFGKFLVFVFVFKYYAMYLDPSLFPRKSGAHSGSPKLVIYNDTLNFNRSNCDHYVNVAIPLQTSNGMYIMQLTLPINSFKVILLTPSIQG